MRRLEALNQLAAALRGEPLADSDWTELLGLANQSLVTPQLSARLAAAGRRAPDDGQGFLDEVARRNAERNRRLWRQLNDATAALNAAGLEPALLKGAARWAQRGDAAGFDRLMSDVDLLVAPAEIERAIAALTAAGFTLLNRYPGHSVHVAAELARPQDAGYLDLHQRPPGPPGIAEPADGAARFETLEIEGGRVRVPDPATQVLFLVLHDQFHDGDYWRGGFDLRHLIDLAELAPMLGAADWAWLREACSDALVRAALDAELLAANRLIGGFDLPVRPRLHALWTYHRWRLQYAWPRLRGPLAAMALALDWPRVRAHRLTDRIGRRRVLGEAEPAPARPGVRLQRLRKILQVEMGKI